MAAQPAKEQKDLVYDGVLYGLVAPLGELARSQAGAALAEELHKSVGKHLAEYLKAQGLRTSMPRHLKTR